jgi:hypothetical protein
MTTARNRVAAAIQTFAGQFKVTVSYLPVKDYIPIETGSTEIDLPHSGGSLPICFAVIRQPVSGSGPFSAKRVP